MREYWNGKYINHLKSNEIFVFGSNPEGRHGAGAAKIARNKFGAIYGFGRGLVGQSYALITKNLTEGFRELSTDITYNKSGINSLSCQQIIDNIKELYQCAINNSDKKFLISYQYETYQNGQPKKTLNGYTSEEMFNFFLQAGTIPDNIIFNESYKIFMEKHMTNNTSDYTYFFNLKSVFSNFHPSLFVVKDIQFISNEQFMMYCKAKLFKDEENAKKILNFNKTPLANKFLNHEITSEYICNNHYKEWNQLMMSIKAIGKKVSPYDDKIWSDKRKNYVKHGVKEKFKQNEDMLQKLKETGNTRMVEATKYDKIWGAGLSEEDAKRIPEKQWPGKNLLGEIFNEFKEELLLDNNYDLPRYF